MLAYMLQSAMSADALTVWVRVLSSLACFAQVLQVANGQLGTCRQHNTAEKSYTVSAYTTQLCNPGHSLAMARHFSTNTVVGNTHAVLWGMSGNYAKRCMRLLLPEDRRRLAPGFDLAGGALNRPPCRISVLFSTSADSGREAKKRFRCVNRPW